MLDTLLVLLPAAFVFLILLWLVWALVIVVGTRDGSATPVERRVVALAPSGMAMLGVLGTFTGVWVGLIQFDTQNVGASVPGLLSGLRFAFLTSVAGLAASLLFRLVHSLLAPAPPARPQPGPTEMHRVLEEIRDAVREAGPGRGGG